MGGFLDFLADQGTGEWVIWTKALAEEEPELREAVAVFDSRDNPAGRAATEWLREEALDNHPSTVTQLLVKDRRVEAFFALCSGHVKFSQRDRNDFGASQAARQTRRSTSCIQPSQSP